MPASSIAEANCISIYFNFTGSCENNLCLEPKNIQLGTNRGHH